jgi:adenylate cyclase
MLIGEITYLNLIMFLMLFLEKKPVTIDSPVLFILFILLIISSLRLEFDYSFTAGIIAALEYLIIVFIALNIYSDSSEFGLKLPAVTYYYRSIFLIAAGFTSGFVAREIKRGVDRSLSNINEKKKIEMLFGQQVEPQIAKALVRETEKSKLMNVSILFFDVRDFTLLVEKRTPDEINHIQNCILSPVVDIIHQYNGIVNQILGDGIMATFGAPTKLIDHPQKAFDASLAIQQKIVSMSESGEIPAINIGIGLHSGPVITGNIGPESRKQYSVSGTTVIISARLEQLNKKYGSSLLISGEVKNKITTNRKIESAGTVRLKGIEKGIEIFRID